LEEKADLELNNENIAKKNLLRSGDIVSGEKVYGYNFDKGLNYNSVFSNFGNVGFQASHLSRAIEITNKMIIDNSFIFLGYTSNMVSSGNRDIIRWLVENKKVDVLVTTTGGIEEDIIKCLGDFKIGDFKANGKELREKGVNRIGNIFVSNNEYVKFEKFVQPILEELYLDMKNGKVITGSDIIWKLGEKINNKESIYYWAWKNKIRVYCPCITDGALGDNIYFFSFKHKDFVIDVVRDVKWFNDTTIGLEKSGALILGSGIVKHAILNANMLRNGLDYSVYVNTSSEFDGSDSGAMPEEAVSWGKIKGDESIKVFADATIVFPIIVGESFMRRNRFKL
jgi:deoxyhypusine synthase